MTDDNKDRIKALKTQGLMLIRNNRFEEAKAVFTHICEILPDDVEAWYLLSSINGRLGNIDEAGNCCRRVIAIQPEHSEAHANLGNVLFYQGKLDEAIIHYQKTLRIKPDNAGALYCLANVFSSQGKYNEAAANYKAAIRLNPNIFEAYYNLGNAQLALKNYDEAAENYLQAIRLNPKQAEVYNNLGNALKAKGSTEGAIENYRRAIQLKPDFAAAYNNLTLILIGEGRLEEADEMSRRALQIQPQSIDAHINIGNIHMERGQLDEAIDHFQLAIKLNQNYAEAYNNLGLAYKKQGRLEEAKQAIEHALELKPDFAEAICNLGIISYSQGFIQAAIEKLRRAILLKADAADAYAYLGHALMEQRDVAAAVESYQHAIALKPDFASVYSMLGVAFRTQGKLQSAEEMTKKALKYQPDFVDAYITLGNIHNLQGKTDAAVQMFRNALQLDPTNTIAHGNLLIAIQYRPEYSAEQLFEAAREWGLRHSPDERGLPPSANIPDRQRRLRVGYVSGDFLNHPVGYFIESVLANHDRSRYEIYCYYNKTIDDDLTKRLKRCSDHWRNIAGESDIAVAQQIRQDGIDLLIDLSGHTGENRLVAFAHKPAPIQATWMGYFATTGLPAMDYIIADRFVIPPQDERYYVEQVVRLPNAYLCFSPPSNPIEPSPLPASASGNITFGCFNNTAKLTETVIACWARLLQALPGAQLYLKNKSFGDAEVRQQYKELFAQHGLAPEQIRFAGPSPRTELLAAYKEVDIGLDPFPYNGGTTTVEALWMGVPVISLRGDRFAGRVGDSFLTIAGLGEYVVGTEDAYIAKAAALASDLPRLAELRSRLRAQLLNSPLCDGPGFTRDLEAAYRGMWETWCRSQT